MAAASWTSTTAMETMTVGIGRMSRTAVRAHTHTATSYNTHSLLNLGVYLPQISKEYVCRLITDTLTHRSEPPKRCGIKQKCEVMCLTRIVPLIVDVLMKMYP